MNEWIENKSLGTNTDLFASPAKLNKILPKYVFKLVHFSNKNIQSESY